MGRDQKMKACEEEGYEEQVQVHLWDHSTEVSQTLSAYQLLKDIKISDQFGRGGTVFSESMLRKITLVSEKMR